MPFTPYRPATPFALTNVVNNQALNVAAINGVTNAMKHLKERGRLPVTVTGTRVNGRVIPALGDAYPTSGNIYLGRKYISIPITIPPSHTRFCMFFNYRLNQWLVDNTVTPNIRIGSDLKIDLVKDLAAVNIAKASFIDLTPGIYLGSQLVIRNLPNLIINPLEPTTCYIRVFLDETSGYILDQTSNYQYVGGQDIWLNTPWPPFPNLITFWNGLMNLSFSTFSECNPC